MGQTCGQTVSGFYPPNLESKLSATSPSLSGSSTPSPLGFFPLYGGSFVNGRLKKTGNEKRMEVWLRVLIA